MGYDIDAFIGAVPLEVWETTVAAAFEAAEGEARVLGGGVDLFLHMGSLDCGLSKHYFEEAVGRRFDDTTQILPAAEFRKLAEKARWPDPADVPPGDLWGYWSARKFFDVCVAHGLGIWSN